MRKLIKEHALGRKILKWLEPYPIDLSGEKPSERQPALISVEGGRVTFASNFGKHQTPGQASVMLAHDIAHFISASDEGLSKPNIGLFVWSDDQTPQTPDMTAELTEMEQQVFTHQIVLLRHFEHPYEKNMEMTLRVAKTMFKIDPDEVWRRAAAATYEDTLAEWERKIGLISA